ncbi:hypothetical protein Shyd_59750 [Streptomyces hydrogenans]|uniref:Uncharacterized protein n=1 Tax=Streptomyces hydrogenans TaxID=1873719 RepID=A0ABQ3PHX2_9ACTN|nr:hypothetical protein Shyd_59750 [Streptomyces hydrogenans]
MWAWVVNDFTFLRRWWKQQCVDHFESGAPDHVTFELIQFPSAAARRLHPDRAARGLRARTVGQDIVIHDGPTGDKALCATPGCWHSTVGKQPEGWRCWECERVEKRRARVHRRWGQTASGSSAW